MIITYCTSRESRAAEDGASAVLPVRKLLGVGGRVKPVA